MQSCVNSALAAIVVVLLLVLAYRLWRPAARRGPPADCTKYGPGPLKTMCQEGVKACGTLAGADAPACRAAVGACLPLVQAGIDVAQMRAGGGLAAGGQTPAGVFNHVAAHVPACARAALEVSPAGAAQALRGMKGLPPVPAAAAPFFQDARTRANVEAIAGLAPGATEWGLDFGRALAAAPAHGS